MKYVFSLLTLALMLGTTFAQVDDTLCRSSQWAQVEAWIIFVDDGSTKFVKCFKWSVLQPIGWSMIYEDIVDVDVSKQPSKISGLDTVWTSLDYGTVYRLPAYRQQQLATTIDTFGTASVIEEWSSMKNMLAIVLVWLLVILWWITLFSRKAKE
jgi:uncharacterized membrane protein